MYRVKTVKNMYKFIGTEEVQLQEYDYGCVSPEFCLLWKDGKKINKKLIKELLTIQADVDEINSQEKPCCTKARGKLGRNDKSFIPGHDPKTKTLLKSKA